MTVQRWPTAWLLTDERMGDGLHTAIARAAAASAGVIVRHHRSSVEQRRAIAERVIAEGALLGISQDLSLAEELGAALVHNPDRVGGVLPFSLSVHDEQAAVTADGATLAFISPVFPTRSHPGAPVLGVDSALELAGQVPSLAIALGGMDAQRGAALMRRGFYGWAGIDCWLKT